MQDLTFVEYTMKTTAMWVKPRKYHTVFPTQYLVWHRKAVLITGVGVIEHFDRVPLDTLGV
jgi:hypothetical protein